MCNDLTPDNSYILEAVDISKGFPGVAALKKVNFHLRKGSVHALLGENGAGKSTLIKVLSGVYSPDRGTIRIDGKPVENLTPSKSLQLGVSVIHQELNLVPEMTIAENIFIGREMKNKLGFLDYAEMNRRSSQLLEKFNLSLKPTTKVIDLSIAYQQMVEILKAISLNAQVLIMDEPTDVLTDEEVNKLFKIVKDLKKEGKSIVYITHKLDEVKEICDEYTILRDGEFIKHDVLGATSKRELINFMVGRELEDQYPYLPGIPEKEVIRVEHLSRKGVLEDISLSVHAGEVVGVFGLVGSGRTELAKCIIGADKFDDGKIFIENQSVMLSSPNKAIKNDLFYTTENRKKEGAFLYLGTSFNTTISALSKIQSKIGLLSSREEHSVTKRMIQQLGIKVASQNAELKNLSGGNQQKVLLARGLLTEPKFMILDEPTRGIDVGAKTEIYQIINALKKQGVAIMVISSELPEILGISDRILVMYQGRISGSYERNDANEKNIMQSAFNETEGTENDR